MKDFKKIVKDMISKDLEIWPAYKGRCSICNQDTIHIRDTHGKNTCKNCGHTK